jgi:hypothetical protein
MNSDQGHLLTWLYGPVGQPRAAVIKLVISVLVGISYILWCVIKAVFGYSKIFDDKSVTMYMLYVFALGLGFDLVINVVTFYIVKYMIYFTRQYHQKEQEYFGNKGVIISPVIISYVMTGLFLILRILNLILLFAVYKDFLAYFVGVVLSFAIPFLLNLMSLIICAPLITIVKVYHFKKGKRGATKVDYGEI